jgi:hypothetical protein
MIDAAEAVAAPKTVIPTNTTATSERLQHGMEPDFLEGEAEKGYKNHAQ